VPGTAADVHYDGTQFGLGRSQGTYARSLRTSLITDPTDGRIPPLTPSGQQRLADRNEARKRRNINCSASSTQTAAMTPPRTTRWTIAASSQGHAGPPMASAGYNGTYQIIQSPGHVMILGREQPCRSHDSHRREAGPPAERSLVDRGFARPLGGNTLVVETSNFNTDLSTPGSGQPAFWYAISANMKVTEWFTRVDANTINYKFTVEDASTWTKPWSSRDPVSWRPSVPSSSTPCHEGNRDMGNILTAARVLEKKAAAEAAAKKGSN
jgi:hypothetical protein